MLSVEILAGFGLSALLLSLSPGPSNLYIMACTIDHGRSAGVAAAGGMAIGSLTYTLLVALGLASLIVVSPLLFLAIKLIGAGYLLYLGLTSLRQQQNTEEMVSKSTGNVFRQSIIVELTNPKTALFFIAFLPQFTQPESGELAYQLLLLGSVYAVIAFCCDLTVVMLSNQLARRIVGKVDNEASWIGYQKFLAGLILIGLGGYILVTELAVRLA